MALISNSALSLGVQITAIFEIDDVKCSYDVETMLLISDPAFEEVRCEA